MIFLIVVIAILCILLVLFGYWFAMSAVRGKCPICALKALRPSRKITIDISEVEDYDNGVAKTPPMGWSSWNTFRNHIDQDLIMETAQAMVDSGLAEAGYQYINLDDCWQSSMRDSDGKLQGDLGTFSRGIPALIKDINSRSYYCISGASSVTDFAFKKLSVNRLAKSFPEILLREILVFGIDNYS